MRRSALIGLLYLENNLATHAFTSERLTVLELHRTYRLLPRVRAHLPLRPDAT
jgi:hypothetical protein